MYTNNARELVQAWGGWLQAQMWDYFSTYTFRYEVSLKRSEHHMLKVEEQLKSEQIAHTLYWVAESPHTTLQSHLHFLIAGQEAQKFIYNYYQTKGMIDHRSVMNEAYDPTLGATFYVSKSLNDAHATYGMSYFAN